MTLRRLVRSSVADETAVIRAAQRKGLQMLQEIVRYRHKVLLAHVARLQHDAELGIEVH